MLQVSEPRNRKRITGIAYFELLEILRIFSPQTCPFLHLQVFLWPNVLGIPTWYWGWGAATRGIRNCGTAHPGSVRTSGLELTQLQIQIKAECEGGSGLQTPAKRKEEVSSSPSSHFLSNLPPLLLVREAALVSHQSPIIQLSTSLRSPTLAKKCMYIYIYIYIYIYVYLYVYVYVYIYWGAVKLSTLSQGKGMEIFEDFHSSEKCTCAVGHFVALSDKGFTGHRTTWAVTHVLRQRHLPPLLKPGSSWALSHTGQHCTRLWPLALLRWKVRDGIWH